MISSKTQANIVYLYNEGLSVTKISNIVELSNTTVYKILKDHSTFVVHSKQQKHDIHSQLYTDTMSEYMSTDMTTQQAADRLNMSPGYFRQLIQEHYSYDKYVDKIDKLREARAIKRCIMDEHTRSEIIAEWYPTKKPVRVLAAQLKVSIPYAHTLLKNWKRGQTND